MHASFEIDNGERAKTAAKESIAGRSQSSGGLGGFFFFFSGVRTVGARAMVMSGSAHTGQDMACMMRPKEKEVTLKLIIFFSCSASARPELLAGARACMATPTYTVAAIDGLFSLCVRDARLIKLLVGWRTRSGRITHGSKPKPELCRWPWR